VAVLAGSAAALWLALIFWTATDIRARSRDPIAILFCTLLAILPGVGVIIYIIIRPKQTLIESYLRSLEEEALLQEIEETPLCPGCRSRVDPEYVMCPHCLTKLKAQCLSCERLIELDWTVCPYCGTDRKFPVAVGIEQ
jgi:RNA polymerase subunit RPABC4/transcription elongation factor Spt4